VHCIPKLKIAPPNFAAFTATPVHVMPDERAALAAAKQMVEHCGGVATVTDADGVEIGTTQSDPKLDS